MPSPVVFRHVSQSSVDTSLYGDSVRSSREKFGDTSGFETSFCETEGCSETCTSSAAVESVVFRSRSQSGPREDRMHWTCARHEGKEQDSHNDGIEFVVDNGVTLLLAKVLLCQLV